MFSRKTKILAEKFPKAKTVIHEKLDHESSLQIANLNPSILSKVSKKTALFCQFTTKVYFHWHHSFISRTNLRRWYNLSYYGSNNCCHNGVMTVFWRHVGTILKESPFCISINLQKLDIFQQYCTWHFFEQEM